MNQEISKINLLFQIKKYGEAEKIVRNLLSQEPDNSVYLSILAKIYLLTKRYDAALEVSETAIGYNPGNSDLYHLKAQILFEQQHYYDADIALKNAIALNPNVATYFSLMANIRLVQELYDFAIDYSKKALRLNPNDVAALNVLAQALHMTGNATESNDAINTALKIDPSNWYTHANFGNILLNTGNIKEALHHFKTSLQNNPDSTYAASGLKKALCLDYQSYKHIAGFNENIKKRPQQTRVILYISSFLIFPLQFTDETSPYKKYLYFGLLLSLIPYFISLVINAVANTYLLTNPFGKYLVQTREKIVAITTTTSIFIYFVSLFMVLFSGGNKTYVTLAIVFLSITALLSSFSIKTVNFYKLVLLHIVVISLGLVAVYFTASKNSILNGYTISYLVLLFTSLVMIKKYNTL